MPDVAHGDARELSFLEAGSVHLVLTSPPYWTLLS
jgi:DNA modification methylase